MHSHGGYEDKLYGTWQEMKLKCEWPEHTAYNSVGKRGIKVADEWVVDYGAFREYALENGYTEETFLHRRRQNEDFKPGNVYFSFVHPVHKRLEYNGESHSLSEWARRQGLKKQTLSKRLKLGWSVGQALGFEPRG